MTISKSLLSEFKSEYQNNKAARTLENAVTHSGIHDIAVDHSLSSRYPDAFSVQAKTGQITNQKASGRCWMFASLNTMRADVLGCLNVDSFEFSETYPFFWDKLEKANYFLESILETKEEPTDGRLIQHLLSGPIQDGGQWDMFKGILEKYGVVPKEAMPETFHSSNSAFMNKIITSKLREFAYELRESENPRSKDEMLYEIYHILCLCLGTPPESFSYEYHDKDGNYKKIDTITPVDFMNQYVGWNLKDKVSIINAPVCGPVTFAAKSLKIPIVLHEQNAYPGKANKMIADSAKAIITCYEEAFSGRDYVHYLGNPRASLIHEEINSSKEVERLNLDLNLNTVLMVMGSQGSTAMNKKFEKFVKYYDDPTTQVIIVTGPLHIDNFKKTVGEVHPNIRLEGFVDQKALLPVIDLIVCRSGASTVAEVESFGLPSLLIPSPYVANNHQFYNAKSLFDKNACDMLLEEDIHDDVLNKHVFELIRNKQRLVELGHNARKLATPDAVSNIADLVEKVVGNDDASQ